MRQISLKKLASLQYAVYDKLKLAEQTIVICFSAWAMNDAVSEGKLSAETAAKLTKAILKNWLLRRICGFDSAPTTVSCFATVI